MMRPAIRRIRRLVAGFTGLLLLALLLSASPASPLAASGALQAGDAVDIADRECSFWLDFDGDGEGDDPIDTAPGGYTRQETAIVGGCEFRLNTPAQSTLVVRSELNRWSSEVELTREPGSPRRVTLQPGDTEIPGLEGGYRVIISHQGATPRSGKSRPVGDDYDHEVQIPRSLRLLEVTVTTPDGISDRLEENIQSASSAYIDVHQRISQYDGDDAASPSVTLAGELLAEGYPQIADRVMALDMASTDKSGINWWMWITIAIIALSALGGIAFAIFIARQNRPGSAASDTNTGRTRRSNM